MCDFRRRFLRHVHLKPTLPREIKALEDHGGSALSLHKAVFLGGGIGEATIRFP